MAKLYFRYGAMNSGKTANLLLAAHNYNEKNMNVLILKPKIDTKSDVNIETRIGLKRKVDHLIKKNENIYNWFIKNSKGISCVFIDEVQLLKPKQIDDLAKITYLENIPVICYGLRTDFLGNLFKASSRLLGIADTIEEIKTICKCGRKSTMNARFKNNKLCRDGAQIEIDNNKDITYKSFCPKCYNKLFNDKSS